MDTDLVLVLFEQNLCELSSAESRVEYQFEGLNGGRLISTRIHTQTLQIHLELSNLRLRGEVKQVFHREQKRWSRAASETVTVCHCGGGWKTLGIYIAPP